MKKVNYKQARKCVEAKEEFRAAQVSGRWIDDKYVVLPHSDCYMPIYVNKGGKWYENSEYWTPDKNISYLRPIDKIKALTTEKMLELYQ